jgi:hypothetical protein
MAQAGAGSAEQQCEPKADDTKRHDTNLAFQRAYNCSQQATPLIYGRGLYGSKADKRGYGGIVR